MGVNGGALTLDKLDELIDPVKGGKPDLLVMSRRSRRTLNKLARTSAVVPADGPRRVRADGAVLRRHPGRRVGLHLGREDRRHEH